mmetsp:Transcript_111365/g.355347  ORF Transcript_111365/g.355347 Transcript_111365/m.355347 type:complete len:229 (+) Transcript_111365:86-772(+)
MGAPMEQRTTFRSYRSMDFPIDTKVGTPKASIERRMRPTLAASFTPSRTTTCGPNVSAPARSGAAAPDLPARPPASTPPSGMAKTERTPWATCLEVPRVTRSKISSVSTQMPGASPASPESTRGPARQGVVRELEDVPTPSSAPSAKAASISALCSIHRLLRTKTARGRMRRNAEPSATKRRLRQRSARRSTRRRSSLKAGFLAEETTCGRLSPGRAPAVATTIFTAL